MVVVVEELVVVVEEVVVVVEEVVVVVDKSETASSQHMIYLCL